MKDCVADWARYANIIRTAYTNNKEKSIIIRLEDLLESPHATSYLLNKFIEQLNPDADVLYDDQTNIDSDRRFQPIENISTAAIDWIDRVLYFINNKEELKTIKFLGYYSELLDKKDIALNQTIETLKKIKSIYDELPI